jgi:hypothetical protein
MQSAAYRSPGMPPIHFDAPPVLQLYIEADATLPHFPVQSEPLAPPRLTAAMSSSWTAQLAAEFVMGASWALGTFMIIDRRIINGRGSPAASIRTSLFQSRKWSMSLSAMPTFRLRVSS